MKVNAMHAGLLSLAVLGLALQGCGAGRAPTGKIAQAETAIGKAEECGAAQYAPLECHLAREKLKEAKQAVQDENYLEARRLAEKAAVDAELAEAKTNSTRAYNTVDELRKSVDAMREEMDRAKAK